MGISRTWNGNIANYIQSPVGNFTNGPAQMTAAGWVKLSGSIPGDYGFMGRFEPESGGVTDGFRFALRDSPSKPLEFNPIKAGVSVGFSVGTSIVAGVWTFVAVTFNSSVSPHEVKFFVGTTPANIVQVGATQTDVNALVGNIGDVRLGQIHHEQGAGVFKFPVNGLMDHWGLWIKALALAELQEFAGKCHIPQYGSITVVIPIIGTSPEQGNGVGDLTVTGTLTTSTDTYEGSFSPAARCWPAYHGGEYLDTGVNLKVRPTGDAVTCCGWVNIDSNFGNAAHTIFGAMNTIATAGFQFRISNPSGGGQIDLVRGSVATLNSASGPITTSGNFSDKAWFVACTLEPGSLKFYAGLTSDTVALIPGNTLVGEDYFPVTDAPDSDYTVYIGQTHLAGITSLSTIPMGGTIDRVGLWYGSVLTLAQLKLVAAGDSLAPYSSAKFFYEITGASPELDSSPNAYSATVQSTTIVAGLGPTPPTHVIHAESSNVVQKMPRISGGVGGGLGVPTLDYGGLGGLDLGPMTDNARSVEVPQFGNTLAKGPRGGRGGVSLGQREHPMFRGLDHLATIIRRKK